MLYLNRKKQLKLLSSCQHYKQKAKTKTEETIKSIQRAQTPQNTRAMMVTIPSINSQIHIPTQMTSRI